MTPGAKFRKALKEEKPLQIPGAIMAYHATLAKASGFKAIYLSGGGVAAGSLGLPDLGISGLEDVLIDVRRITALTQSGVRRRLGIDLTEVEGLRPEIAAAVAEVAALPEEKRQVALAEAGLQAPHWPAPYGRAACRALPYRAMSSPANPTR